MNFRKTFVPKGLFTSKILTFFLVLFVVSLALGQLMLANAYSTKGDDLRKLDTHLQALREENQRLRNDIARLSSLGRIEDEAGKLGMVALESSNIELLTDPALVLFR